MVTLLPLSVTIYNISGFSLGGETEFGPAPPPPLQKKSAEVMEEMLVCGDNNLQCSAPSVFQISIR